MSSVQRDRLLPRVSRLGGGLVAVALVAVVVAYPPPATGVRPLFGVGNVFLPLAVSVLSFLVALVGGVLLARDVTNARTDRVQRLAFAIVTALAPVALVGAYLTAVAGFSLQSPFILGAVILAAVGGAVNGLRG